MLGIPWRRLLNHEIAIEQRLREQLPDATAECALEDAFEILSAEALRSWRVREQLETLAWQARASVRGAERKLRALWRPAADQVAPDSPAVGRFDAAYRRILLLQRARRAAARSVGTPAERLAFVCTAARCRFEDAEWALAEESSPKRGRRMEAAVRKAREEGFFVPKGATEARSLASLRRIVFGFRDAFSKNGTDAAS
jgi:hypothetical protein